jgi:hypothetical protein
MTLTIQNPNAWRCSKIRTSLFWLAEVFGAMLNLTATERRTTVLTTFSMTAIITPSSMHKCRLNQTTER